MYLTYFQNMVFKYGFIQVFRFKDIIFISIGGISLISNAYKICVP